MEKELATLTHRNFLMAHAANQDFLLQALRLQLWAFEIGIAIPVLTLAWSPLHWACKAVALLVLVLTHQRKGQGFREAISFRAKDVDWAQKQVLLSETHLPSDMRTMTRFKVYQDRKPELRDTHQQVLLSETYSATEAEIEAYFFAHKSQSRGKAAMLLGYFPRVVWLVALVGVFVTS